MNTHIPVSRETPYPGGGEMPRMYIHAYDPFVACTAAASATRQLKIGTEVCLVVERDPIITAKEVASVDRLSGGRFLFGAGWLAQSVSAENLDEFAERAATLQQRAADAGRDRLPISLFAASSKPGMAERYAAAGIDRCLYLLPDADSPEVTRRLDKLAEQVL